MGFHKASHKLKTKPIKQSFREKVPRKELGGEGVEKHYITFSKRKLISSKYHGGQNLIKGAQQHLKAAPQQSRYKTSGCQTAFYRHPL